MIDPEILDHRRSIFLAGRDGDIGRWAFDGLGIKLHDKQLGALEALDNDPATFHLWWWANRVGKTTAVVIWHLYGITYKPEMPGADVTGREKWLATDYRTLHSAPLGILATRAFEIIGEIIRGTNRAQYDEDTSKYRPSPLGALFAQAKERDAHGAEHMVVRSLSGGTTDFYSTEGGAARLEGVAWRRISWDEWPQTEGADKGEAVRTVLLRLQNRASDYDSKVLLTGTITPETEHIAKDWIERCEDPDDPDWYGSTATRLDNPGASRKSIELAKRSVESGAMDEEDYARTVMGVPGGVRNRVFPAYMVDPIFRNELPRFQPPQEGDGVQFQPLPTVERPSWRPEDTPTASPRGRFVPRSPQQKYVYLHIWDLAIAAADNIGQVWRLPADWKFSAENPIVGVKHVRIPGSRTLTSAEIVHTIEETFLPYGGQIVLDTTDAHGKNIYRELSRAGYPVIGFAFNERDHRRVIKKDQAIHYARELMTEGMNPQRDASGEIILDALGVPKFDREKPYGVLRLPPQWVRARDQLSILQVEDTKQRKDEAMVVLMGCYTAYRGRRTRTRRHTTSSFVVFGGGRRLGVS